MKKRIIITHLNCQSWLVLVIAVLFGGCSSPKTDDPSMAATAAAYFHDTDLNKIREAAARNNPAGQTYLGMAYALGHGVPQDFKEAAFWFQKAADQDYGPGCNSLAVLYDEGKGVQKNEVKAFDLYLRAAVRGVVSAQTSLGIKYANGQGVPRNSIEAYDRASWPKVIIEDCW
jgi:TPR repeat protein